MSGVVARPVVVKIRRAARPVGKPATGNLEQTQPIDPCADVGVDVTLLLLIELDQRREIKLREDRRRRLLDAAVRISNQVVETALEVERTDGRGFERDFVGAR